MIHTPNGLATANAADPALSEPDLGQIRAVVDQLPQLAWSCLPDGHCDYLSRRWVEYTGVPESEHHGRGWLDAVHPDDRERTRDGWDAFVAGTAPYDVDYRLRRHDGAYRWFKTRGVLVRGANGKPLRVLGTTTDVDDQKRAEGRDRESRERLEAALEASGTGTFRWDIVTNALDWDRELDRLFGLPPGRTVRSLERFVELVHPDDRAGVLERCRRCKEEGADFAMEFRVVRPDGSVRWLDDRGRTFRDAAGRPAYMTGACVDVTERKRAEERARAADERAEFVRRASGVGFWYCDLPFDELQWDERVKEHFHLPPDARVTIDTFYARMHPDDRGPTRRAIERSIARREQYDVHYRTVSPETGAEKWVRAIGRTSYAPDGTPRRFDGLTLDVTGQRRAEERQRFLADLAAATQPLADPDEVTATTARLLAEHLGCDRCAYAEVEGESVYAITGDYTRGVPSIVGRWEVAAFGAEHHRLMRADEAYVVDDTDADPRIGPADLAAYRATTIRAVVCVALHKGGRFTAAMAVHQAAPRRWAADEVELVRTVVGRCWEALERARVGRSLRESEERFRSLFESMDEGYCVVEPVLDADGRAVDYRYLLANPALEHHTGLRDVAGRTAREVMPHHESVWIEAYARVAATGEPFRRTDFVADLGRWYEVSAFRVGEPGGRQVGVLFADVTARVRAEAELRASEERFRAFMDHSPAAAWVTDRDGRVRYVSATYRRLFALPDRELVGAVPGSTPTSSPASTSRTSAPWRTPGRHWRRSNGRPGPTARSASSSSTSSRSRAASGWAGWRSTSPSGCGPRSSSARPTGGRTSSWRCWPTNSATRSRRCATGCR
jgi:PAS domain S-box-containing protein